MLDILNAVYIGAVLISSINLYSDEDYKLTGTLDSIVEVSAHREWWREDGNGKCSFKGALIPFARDWEEVDESVYPPVVRPAIPDKIAGQAMIITKKVCKAESGEVVTPMFSGTLMWRAYDRMHRKSQVLVQDLSSLTPENKPQWLPGVLARVEKLAVTDPVAKSFLTELTASVEALTKAASSDAEGNTTSEVPAPAPSPAEVLPQAQDVEGLIDRGAPTADVGVTTPPESAAELSGTVSAAPVQ